MFAENLKARLSNYPRPKGKRRSEEGWAVYEPVWLLPGPSQSGEKRKDLTSFFLFLFLFSFIFSFCGSLYTYYFVSVQVEAFIRVFIIRYSLPDERIPARGKKVSRQYKIACIRDSEHQLPPTRHLIPRKDVLRSPATIDHALAAFIRPVIKITRSVYSFHIQDIYIYASVYSARWVHSGFRLLPFLLRPVGLSNCIYMPIHGVEACSEEGQGVESFSWGYTRKNKKKKFSTFTAGDKNWKIGKFPLGNTRNFVSRMNLQRFI